jgi:hypothetical protein
MSRQSAPERRLRTIAAIGDVGGEVWLNQIYSL